MNSDDPTLPVSTPQGETMSDTAIERMLAAGANPNGRHTTWLPPDTEELQKLLPDYEVQALIGRGGMGAVYRGVQKSLDRPVAIKVLPPEVAGCDPQFAARFQQEAKAMARLSHPHIVPVHDFGETPDGMLYFVMEFIDGTDLQHIIKSEGHLSPRRASAIIAQVCDALEFAHEHGIVHRDIKPSNIMVDKRGQVKVADFGLAKTLHANEAFTSAATMTGTIMGTMAYMAPEQAQGRKVDHRADIYSLGAMFYEMLTGTPPHGAIEAPSHKIEIDVRLDGIVLKALATDPDRRYQHASEVKSDVTQVTEHPVVEKKKEKGKRLAQAALIIASLAVGAFFALNKPQGRADGPPSAAAPPQTGALGQSALPTTAPNTTFPPGHWISAFPTWDRLPRHVRVKERGLVWKEGWITPTLGASTIVLSNQKIEGRNWGIRAKFRSDGKDPKMIQANVRNVSDNGMTKLYAIGMSDHGNPCLGVFNQKDKKPSNTDYKMLAVDERLTYPKEGDVFEMELIAIGSRLFGRFNGRQLKPVEDTNLASGMVSIFTHVPVRDIEVINLDGLSEAEALKAAGITESLTPATTTPPAASTAPATAIQAAPFVNTLGMKFVPVPIVGGPTKDQRLLFSVWETRVQDYEVFVKEAKHRLERPQFDQGPDHPAVNVSWDDAQVFCAWLTQRERQVGTIRADDTYRLPSDFEWSCAASIGEYEDPTLITIERSGKSTSDYPWGGAWPPPPDAGNYAGKETTPKLSHPIFKECYNTVLNDWSDAFIFTAPVGSFQANRLGLHDLGGNVMEWCEDWYRQDQQYRVLRGGSFIYNQQGRLRAAIRDGRGQASRALHGGGFRCVLHLSPGQAIQPARRHDPALSRECAELALSKGARVIVNGSQSVLPGQALPPGDLQIHHVIFRPVTGQHYDATPQDLIQMVRAPEIFEVTCYNMPGALSAESCAAIAALPRLSRLAFRDSRLNESWLEPFRGHPSLQRLELMSSGISDTGLEHFADCPFLLAINVAETTITPQGLAKLRARTTLTELGYGRANRTVTEEIKELLTLCPQLTRFILAGNFTPDALAGIAAMKQLAWIDFNASHIDEPIVRTLKDAPALAKVAFGHGTNVTPAAWGAMADLPKLETLMLVSRAWPEALERALPALPHLKRLELDRVSGLDPDGIERLRRELPKCVITITPGTSNATTTPVQGANLSPDRAAALRVLARGGNVTVKLRSGTFQTIRSGAALPDAEFDLEQVAMSTVGPERPNDFNDDDLATFMGLPKLRYVQLNNTVITGKGLAVLQTLPSLSDLRLNGNDQLRDADLAQLKGCRALGRLELNRTPTFTTAAMEHVAALSQLRDLRPSGFFTDEDLLILLRLRRLKTLGVPYNITFRAETLEQLHALPELEELSVTLTGLERPMNFAAFPALTKISILGLTSDVVKSLSTAPHLEFLTVETDTRPAPAALAQLTLTPLKELRHLYLKLNNPLPPGDHFAALPKLERVVASNRGATNAFDDAALLGLAKVTTLKSVMLEHAAPKLTPEGLAAFRKLRPEVKIEGAGVPTASVSLAKASTRQIAERILALGGTVGYPGKGQRVSIQKAADIPSGDFDIDYIELPSSRPAEAVIREEDFALIGQCLQVTQLRLSRLSFTPTMNQALEQLKMLRELTLREAVLDEETMKAIGKLMLLQDLQLDQCPISGPELAALAALPKLSTMALTNLPLDRDGLAPLAKFHALQFLALHGGGFLDDTSLRTLPTTIKTLQRLQFSALNKVTGPGWEHLATMSHVREVQILSCTDASLRSLLAIVPKMPGLEKLQLTNAALSDAEIPVLSELKQLTALEMPSAKLTAAGLQRLRQALPKCHIADSLPR